MKHSPAYRLAATILHGFDGYRARFKQITFDASRRFRDAAWRDAQQASAARINLYGEKVAQNVSQLMSMIFVFQITLVINRLMNPWWLMVQIGRAHV